MQISCKPNLKILVLVLNILLIFLCVGYFLGHGMPQSLMLWVSAMLWFVTPLVNFFIFLRIKRLGKYHNINLPSLEFLTFFFPFYKIIAKIK